MKIGTLLFNALAMIAEFEADLNKLRTREGMALARTKGRLRGKKPKFSPAHKKRLVSLYRADGHTSSEFAH